MEDPVSRIAAAAAFAAMIVLVSDPSHARPRLRIFSSSPKPVVVPKPAAAPAAAASARNGYPSVFIAVGSRPAAAAGAPQQAVSDPGPSLYNPAPASAEAKPAAAEGKTEPLKELTAAPGTDCAMKELSPAKDKEELPKTEPARSRSAFLVPVVNRHPLAPAPRRAVVCYVQRDGTCAP
jgi:hypothetical protein